MIKISALIITRNEEHIIARCLNSLLWADEIIVVDGESEDDTLKICSDPSAAWSKKIKTFTRSWTGFKDQRMFAMDQAKNEWVFVIDSDEACSPELQSKMKAWTETVQNPTHSTYKVRRQEYFLNKPIFFGIWNPSYQDRFFKKTGVHYVNDIHEYPIFQVQPEKIHEPIIHDPSFAPQKFLHKMNIYTSIEAKNRVEAGQRTNFFRILFAFPAMFLKNYFYYKAYKDGYHGFVISILEGISRAVRHVKIWQYTQELNSKK